MSVTRPAPLWQADTVTEFQAQGTNDGVRLYDFVLIGTGGSEGVYQVTTVGASTCTLTARGGGGAGLNGLQEIDISGLSGVQGAWSFEDQSSGGANRLNDRSGNGFDLQLTGGPSLRYASMYGKQWVDRQEETRIERSVHDAALAITGAFTGHQLFMRGATGQEPSAGSYLFAFNEGGSGSATNILYSLRTDTAADVMFEAFHERGSGSNELAQFDVRPPNATPVLYSLTRASNGVDYSLYFNGQLVNSQSVANAPDFTGTTGVFALCLQGDTNQALHGYVGDTVIQNVEMSANDILAIAQQVGVAP